MGKLKDSIRALGYAFNGEEPSGRNATTMLKDFGSELTKQPVVGGSISAILLDIANKKAMKIEAVTSDLIDLLGKHASDLQSDISFGEDGISGTVKYVTGYTGFSGDTKQQSGNYIALKATSKAGAVITAEIIGGISGPVTLDEDGILVGHLLDTATAVRFVATKGDERYVIEYSLEGLTRLDE